VNADNINSGRVQKAPENFLTQSGIKEVFAEGKKGRRDFIRNAFAAAAAGAAAPMAMAQGNPVPVEGGDPNILNLPAHAVPAWGRAWLSPGYGKPSQVRSQFTASSKPGPDTNHPSLGVVCTTCSLCLASSRPAVCISSVIIKAGGTSIRPSIASWSMAW
jgi:hypothetical protein